MSVLRPVALQLVPIFVCLFLIPFAVCLSIFAGWMVWKSLSVGWEVPLYLQYGERIVPYAFAAIPSIQAFQPYDVSLHMRLPISDSNISLGNFMATVTLMTPSNQTLAAASRPALVLPPKPSWLSGSPSAIDLDMTILSSFVAKTSDVLAFVEIGRRDGWRSLGNGQGREVSVLSAKLRGREIPRGTRGLAIRYPLIASTLAACIFLLILSLVIGTCVLPATFSTATGEVNSQHQAKNASKSVSDPPPSLASRSRSHSTPLRKRRFNITRRLSGNLRTDLPKTQKSSDEVPVPLMPSSGTATDNIPEVTVRAASSPAEAVRDKLRRRTLHQRDKSSEDQH